MAKRADATSYASQGKLNAIMAQKRGGGHAA